MNPLILMPTSADWRLLYRGADKYLRINDVGADAIKYSVSSRLNLPPSIRYAAKEQWGLSLDQSADKIVQIRNFSSWSFENASWELNLRCDYDCEHCYLGYKQADTLEMAQRERIVQTMSELGVYRLQITGGEPLIDRWFEPTYRLIANAGIVIRISTNGSQLYRQSLRSLFVEIPPTHITVSLYGATAETYESLTRTPAGTFNRFHLGVKAAAESGLTLHFSIIITRHNEHERDLMVAWAEQYGKRVTVYDRLSATLHGTGEVLSAQAKSAQNYRNAPTFTGCEAGVTFFHVDPCGRASICKMARDPYVQLNRDGAESMSAMADMNVKLLSRKEGCTKCSINALCSTCPPKVKTYRSANAPLSFYCQQP